jgi:hypothetical protein
MENIQFLIKTKDGKEIPIESEWSVYPGSEDSPKIYPEIHNEIVNILFDSIKNFIIREKIKVTNIKEILFIER